MNLTVVEQANLRIHDAEEVAVSRQELEEMRQEFEKLLPSSEPQSAKEVEDAGTFATTKEFGQGVPKVTWKDDHETFAAADTERADSADVAGGACGTEQHLRRVLAREAVAHQSSKA